MEHNAAHLWEYHNPTRIVFGADQRQRLAQLVSNRRALIVSSKRGRQAAQLDPLLAPFVNRANYWIDAVEPNPDISFLEDEIGRMASEIDVIVAIGGGSTIDAAKAFSALLSCRSAGKTLRSLIQTPGQLPDASAVEIIAVPTTAGTGSEVTPFATVWDHSARKKLSLAHPTLFPAIAVIDPALTYDLPRDVTFATGFDALNQAFESVWNRNASPYTFQLAARAVGSGIAALNTLSTDLNSAGARSAMSEASLIAGLCISQTRTALCHSISYPLTAHWGMPHGLACAFTMRAVAEAVLKHNPGLLDSFASAAGLGNGRKLISALHALYDSSDFNGIARQFIPSLEALLALQGEMVTPGRSDNFVMEPTSELLAEILSTSYEALGS